MTQPRQGISSLLNNLHINLLATLPRWTAVNETAFTEEQILASNKLVSSAFTSAKVPIDMQHFIRTNRLRGAVRTDNFCLVTLPEVIQAIPASNNACFYLQSLTDGYLILDIEPEASPETKAKFLSLPNIVYAETSLSGNGYHLLMPLPKNFHDFPIATGKRALKHPTEHWEILLNHYVTFTTMTLPSLPAPDPNGPTLETIWAEIAPTAQEVVRTEINLSIDKPQIPHETELLAGLRNSRYRKKPEDFNLDYSRYEFGYIAYLYRTLIRLISTLIADTEYRPDKILREDFSTDAIAWLIYQILLEKLEHRDKHDEERHGLPWLLYHTMSFLSTVKPSELPEA